MDSQIINKLQVLNSIQNDSENELVQKILERCSQKKQLSDEQIKTFLGNIALYLSKKKKQTRQIKQQKNNQIINLKKIIEDNWLKNHKEQQQNRLNHKQKLDQKIEKIDQQLKRNHEKQTKIQNQLDRLEQQKLNKSQIAEMRVQSERISKQLQLIKVKLQKYINILGQRLERVEKSLEKKQSNFRERQARMEEKIKSPEKDERIQKKFFVTNWVDLDSKYFNDLLLCGSTITARSLAKIFGRMKIEGQYTFTATFSKMYYAELGVCDTLNKNGWKNKNYVLYRSDKNCNVCGRFNVKGNGFKEGEKVTVFIDLKQGCIQWQVGTDIRHKETVQILKNSSIIWVPYIELRDQDDSVQISEY